MTGKSSNMDANLRRLQQMRSGKTPEKQIDSFLSTIIHQQDKDGWTILHHAVMNSWEDIIESALKKQIPADAKSNIGETPLHLAAYIGSLSSFKMLQGKVRKLSHKDDDGWDVLFHAVAGGNIGMLNFLLENGMDPVTKDIYSATPLHYATLIKPGGDFSKENNPLCIDETHIISRLIEHNAKIDAEDSSGQTPLHWAASYGSIGTVSLLIRNGACVNAKDMRNRTPLHLSAKSGNEDISLLLMENGAEEDSRDDKLCSPMHYAAFSDSVKLVKMLITKGAHIVSQDKNFRIPLHYACRNNAVNVIRLLLKIDHSKLEYPDGSNITPLNISVINDNAEAAELLIILGANPEKEDRRECSSLHYAVRHNSLSAAEMLIDRGMNINGQDNQGNSPLHIAVDLDCKDMMNLLIGKNADMSLENKKGRTPQQIYNFRREGLISRQFYNSRREGLVSSENMNPPLLQAAAAGRWYAIEEAAYRQDDLNIANTAGETLLHLAARSGNVKCLETTLKVFSDVNVRDKNGRTPLHTAARTGRVEIISILCKSGADRNITDKEGRTPLDMAIRSGNSDAVKELDPDSGGG